MFFTLQNFALFALLAARLPSSLAHSWVEEFQIIDTNGSYVGDRGYARGYMARTDPGYNGFSDQYMLPLLEARNDDGTARTRINSSDLLCHPSQRSQNYTTFPMLQVAPGDYVAMKYLENGHVTLPWNITGKPAGTGTVFVFGTTNPDVASEKIANVMAWTADGSGGDKRGFLLTAQDFDDGRCHQLNCGNISHQRQMLSPNHVAGQPDSTVESWCETDLKVPDSAKAGKLTIYWVWQWPTAPNTDCNAPYGKDEYYTTCADFDVVVGGDTAPKAIQSAAPGQNPQSVAVSNYQSRIAHTTTASVVLMEKNKVIGTTPTAAAGFLSACTVSASVASANGLTGWPQVLVPNTCDLVTSFGTAAAASASAAYGSLAASYSVQRDSVVGGAFSKAGIKMNIVIDAAAAALSSAAPVTSSPSSSAAAAPASTLATTAPATSAPAASATSAPLSAPSASTPISAPPAISTNDLPGPTQFITVTQTVSVTISVPAAAASTPASYSSTVSTIQAAPTAPSSGPIVFSTFSITALPTPLATTNIPMLAVANSAGQVMEDPECTPSVMPKRHARGFSR